jgi:spore maturation protein A
MNAIFTILFLCANAILLFTAPENFLSALLEGSTRAATLCFSLVSSYALWLGLTQLWQDSGLSKKISALLRPIARRIFKTDDKETLEAVCMNLSVNLLGISGAATPYGIRAAKLLNERENGEYASAMFFVFNATSLQLIPTSIIGIRVSLGATSPADILLPTLFSTVFSTALALALTFLFLSPKRKSRVLKTAYLNKIKGAGI